MDREEFRNRLKQYKQAREKNPGLKYWDWKGIPKYEGGTGGVSQPFTTDGNNWRKRPTQEQLDAFYKGDVQRQIELAEQAGQTITYTQPELDKIVITANRPKTNSYTETDLAKDIMGFTPIGDIIDIYDAGRAISKGNYSEAAMLGAGLLIPNWLEKSGKFFLKTGKNLLKGKKHFNKIEPSNFNFYNIPENHITQNYPKDKHQLAIRHLIGNDKSYDTFTEDGSHLLYTIVDDNNFDLVTARDFYKKDVMPRMKRTYKDAILTSEQMVDKSLFTQIAKINPFDDQIVIRSNAFEFDDYSGAHSFDNGTTFIRLNDRFLKEGLPTVATLIHETEHAQRELINDLLNKSKSPFLIKYPKAKQFSTSSSEQTLPDIGFGPYLHNEKSVLDDAYKFTDNFLRKYPMKPLFEKGATNRELRGMISLTNDNGPIYDLDLDKYIDNLPNDLLLQYMSDVNAYMNSFIKQIAKDFGIKNKDYTNVPDYLKAISHNPGFDGAMKRVKKALKTSFAEGGQIEQIVE